MNLADILKALPPRVYLRSGELVIQFSTPGDLVARVAETQAALSELERPELSRSDSRTRGRANGRASLIGHGETTGLTEGESYPGSVARTSDGKEDWPMASIRRVVCISYETGKTVTRNGRTYPDSRLLTVGSAFVDSESGRIKGQFRAVPPHWDGEFLILDPLPKRDDQPDEDVST
jgi:hypothetical protein